MRTSLALVLVALICCFVFCAAQEVDLLSDNAPLKFDYEQVEEESDKQLGEYFKKAVKEHFAKKQKKTTEEQPAETEEKKKVKVDWKKVYDKLKQIREQRKTDKKADKKPEKKSTKLSRKDIAALVKKVKEMKKSVVTAQSDSMIGGGVTLQATDAVNVRSGPCTNKAIVTTLGSGQTVKSTGWSGSDCGYLWYGVQGSFGYGYVAANFVREVGHSPSPSPSPVPSGNGVSVDQLRRIMPNLSSSKANDYIGHLNNAMSWGQINTCLRRSAFLAQLAHESAEFRYMEEIASGAAYEGRKDLGNIYPGDGVRYKGRGPIQLTGRANYRAAGSALGVDFENNPTIVATPQWGFKVAAWFWQTRSLNSYADSRDFDTITRRINGGFNGKADRDMYYARAKSVLGC